MSRRRSRTEWGVLVVLLLPFLTLLALFTIQPAIRALADSFREFSALNPSVFTWVGTAQYERVLTDPSFVRSILNTLTLMLICVPLQTAIALILANALNQRLRGRGFFRAVFFLPYITAPVAVGAVMLFLFGPQGLLTRWAHSLLGTTSQAWYATPGYAFALVAMVMIWTQIGFFTVLFLAGMQSIPDEVIEAASLDGAGWWRILLRVKLPILAPTISLVMVMGVIVTLQVFEQPYVLSTTGGALPGSPADSTLTMVMYLYAEAFRYYRLGSASAAAFIVMGLIVAFSILQSLLQRKASAS